MFQLHHICIRSWSSAFRIHCHQMCFLKPRYCLACTGKFRSTKQSPDPLRYDKEEHRFLQRTEHEFQEFRVNNLIHITHKLYLRYQSENSPDMDPVYRVLEAVYNHKLPLNHLEQSMEIVKEISQLDEVSRVKVGILKDLKTVCDKMSNLELTALLFHILQDAETAMNTRWAQAIFAKAVEVLERELCIRLNLSFMKEAEKTMNTVEFERLICMMLRYRRRSQCSKAYIRYCTYNFDTCVTPKNLKLLLLSVIETRWRSPAVFTQIEDYILRNYDDLSKSVISLFGLAAISCSTQINSVKLLDLLASTSLQDIRIHKKNFKHTDIHEIINVFKLLHSSGYVKMSFYHNLESLLISTNFIEQCNLNQLMHILKMFKVVRLCPNLLLERSVERCKYLLMFDRKCCRTKDLGVIVHTLGQFQYEDTIDENIYSLCADALIHLDSSREPVRFTVMYLTMCASGLLYARKFHEGLFDQLYGIPGVAAEAENTKRSDLLMVDASLKLMYPENKIRKIPKSDIKRLMKKLEEDTKWNISDELRMIDGFQQNLAVLSSLLDPERITLKYILPYIKSADIVLSLDAENKVVEPKFGQKKVAVEVICHGHCFSNTNTLLGRYAHKLRMLELLGYKIIKALPHEYYDVMQYGSAEEKQEFWIDKLEAGGIVLDNTGQRIKR